MPYLVSGILHFMKHVSRKAYEQILITATLICFIVAVYFFFVIRSLSAEITLLTYKTRQYKTHAKEFSTRLEGIEATAAACLRAKE